MMIKVMDKQLEKTIALKVLRKYKVGSCPKKAAAAIKILKDKKLLDEYVQTIIDRRGKKLSPKKEKKLTSWKRFVNMISRKA